ncbi:MAG TPA: Ig-like domain-containing protein, partial [Candidatus Limnocylindria bacterium]|nr:Ig-like domain-containing protein [Candidatus Limnocylindria bacterium]
IVMANVLTGEVRRLAHHRSRGISGGSYYYQPRVSAGWDGTRVAWASNFGYNGSNYGDIYAIAVDSSGSEPPPPGTPTVTFTNPAAGATLSGTVTVTLNATGGSGTGYTYTLAVDGVNVYSGTNNSFNWNTTNVSNASHTLKATVTDSAGTAGTASRTVTVSNSAMSTLVPSFTTSLGGTLAGSKKIGMAVTGSTASHRTFILFIDGVRVFKRKTTGTKVAYTWDTTTVTNAKHTLRVKVIDSNGNAASAFLAVTVSNAASTTTGLVAAFTSPGAGDTLGCSQTIGMKATGSTASTRTFKFYVNIYLVWQKTITGTTASYTLDTNWWAGSGEHALKLEVTDSAGKSDTAAMKVNVRC